MEKVLGIGGFFWRAKDPDALAKWYEDNLGIIGVPGSYGAKSWEQEAGATVFVPFKHDTTYFAADKQWMINFRVRDLKAMVAQLTANGIAVEVDPETYPNGWFASLKDPEGNSIQLWQEEDKAPSAAG